MPLRLYTMLAEGSVDGRLSEILDSECHEAREGRRTDNSCHSSVSEINAFAAAMVEAEACVDTMLIDSAFPSFAAKCNVHYTQPELIKLSTVWAGNGNKRRTFRPGLRKDKVAREKLAPTRMCACEAPGHVEAQGETQ